MARRARAGYRPPPRPSPASGGGRLRAPACGGGGSGSPESGRGGSGVEPLHHDLRHRQVEHHEGAQQRRCGRAGEIDERIDGKIFQERPYLGFRRQAAAGEPGVHLIQRGSGAVDRHGGRRISLRPIKSCRPGLPRAMAGTRASSSTRSVNALPERPAPAAASIWRSSSLRCAASDSGGSGNSHRHCSRPSSAKRNRLVRMSRLAPSVRAVSNARSTARTVWAFAGFTRCGPPCGSASRIAQDRR